MLAHLSHLQANDFGEFAFLGNVSEILTENPSFVTRNLRKMRLG